MVGHDFRVLGRGVLGSSVEMKHCGASDRWADPGCHGQGLADQLGAHVTGHGVADYLLGEAVHDRGQIDESLPCRDVGDVTHPCHRRRVGGEVPVEPVWSTRKVRGLDRGPGLLPGLTRSHVVGGHDLPDGLRAGLDSVAGEFGPDAAVAVGLVGVGEEPGDDDSQVLSPSGCCRQGSVAPGVVTGSGMLPPHRAHGAGRGWLPSSLRMNPYLTLTWIPGRRRPPLFSGTRPPSGPRGVPLSTV